MSEGEGFPAFDNPWYAKIIERFSVDTGDEVEASMRIAEAIDYLARNIVAAACVIAESVDGLAREIERAVPTQAEAKR
jgi:hypothetical protein